MRKLARKWAFKASMIEDAPETAGLYALWDSETLLHVGHANGGEDSIRARLLAHLERALGAQRLSPTHYSWEICSNPREREAQALAELTRPDPAQGDARTAEPHGGDTEQASA